MRTLMGHDVLPHEALAAVSPVKSLEARRGMQTHGPVAPPVAAANRPIATHAVPRPVSLRGRAAWQCVTVRACRAGCGPQPSVSPGTPMICNAGEAFSLRSILILGKCAGLGPAAICPPLSSITGLVVFDIWQAVDILLPDGICLADPGNTLGSDPHVHWKITAHNRCV